MLYQAGLDVAHAPHRRALDGEAIRLDAPLRFAIRPLALRVRIAARHRGRSRT